MDRILETFYSEKSRRKNPDNLAEEQQAVYREMELWRRQLPAHLTFHVSNSESTAPLPHVLCLHILFHLLTILLHRPFLSTGSVPSLSGHLYTKTSTPGPATKSFLISAFAASQISSILSLWIRSGLDMHRAPHLVTYATYVSATIHVRIAAQRSPGSSTHSALKVCLDILEVHAQPCLASRRALGVILQLMKKLEVLVGSNTEAAGWNDAASGRFSPARLPENHAPIGAVDGTGAQDGVTLAAGEAHSGSSDGHHAHYDIVSSGYENSRDGTFELLLADGGREKFDQNDALDVEMEYEPLANMGPTTMSWFNSGEDDLLF